jgi:hypothetical protein
MTMLPMDYTGPQTYATGPQTYARSPNRVAGRTVLVIAVMLVVAWLAYGGFKGAQMTGEDIAEHGEQGQLPTALDEYGHPLGYRLAP